MDNLGRLTILLKKIWGGPADSLTWLLEWNLLLGKSPLDCLVLGESGQVIDVLEGMLQKTSET